MRHFFRKFDKPQVGAGVGLLAAVITIICGLVVANNPTETQQQLHKHAPVVPAPKSPSPSQSEHPSPEPPPHETVHPEKPKPDPIVPLPENPPSPVPPPKDGTLVSLVNQLKVADEHNQGYDRDEFGSRAPTAATRDQLIANEKLPDGTWVSMWDGKVYKSPDGMDADHTVALAEAWGSGAWSWSKEKRESYANDLNDPYVLDLITASLNRGPKSDNDPYEWMPSVNECEYVKEWTTVKLDWGLSADGEEKMALHNEALDCDAKD